MLLPVPLLSDAEKAHLSREQTQRQLKEAQKHLTSGSVDVLEDLSELLVPNIRAVSLMFSDCGAEGEVDFAGSRELADPAFGIRDDPRLAGVNLIHYRHEIRVFAGESSLGPTCNAEFRSHFSESLKAKLSRQDLEQIWLFLTARKREGGVYGGVYSRLVVFEGDTRSPPVRWWGADQWIIKDLTRFVAKERRGRELAQAMDDFWQQNGQALGNDDLVCPKSAMQWRLDRDRLVNAILQERDRRINRSPGSQ